MFHSIFYSHFLFGFTSWFQLAAENAPEGEYHESEQEKPLLEQRDKRNEATVTTSFEKRSNFRKKSVDDQKCRSVEGNSTTARNVEGIELASEVCPFGLAKNLEKQICIIPSRKKSKCHITLWKCKQIPFFLFSFSDIKYFCCHYIFLYILLFEYDAF